MRKNMITVFTATYNRCHTLIQLYDSLCRQSEKNFLWLVIDDGSTDGTREYIERCRKDNIINIEYLSQKNSGKHVAFNYGVQSCHTTLFFCVDSDDYLTDNAIELVLAAWKNKTDKTAGIVAYRGYKDGNMIGTPFPRDIIYDTLRGLYKKGKTGDTALIYQTDILKKYPFPVFAGEKFMRESIIYNCIDNEFNLIVLPEIIYIGEYFEDGLSKNARRYDEESPNGAALYRLDMFKHAVKKKERFFYGIAYCYFMIKAGRKLEINENIGNKWGTICKLSVRLEMIRRRFI